MFTTIQYYVLVDFRTVNLYLYKNTKLLPIVWGIFDVQDISGFGSTSVFMWMVVIILTDFYHYFNLILVEAVSAGHSGRAVWGVGVGRLVAGIVSLDPAQGTDVCPRLSVLCCPV
jgi:hypothetical protein